MRFLQLVAVLIIVTVSSNAMAERKSKSNSRIGLDVGVAYDLGLGITAQYNSYSLFINSGAVAFDVRMQNFYNDRRTIHVYIDLGGFVDSYNGNDITRDDKAGIRAPIGMTFGLERNLEVYIQAVPNFDFSNNEKFNVDAAAGIRYRF